MVSFPGELQIGRGLGNCLWIRRGVDLNRSSGLWRNCITSLSLGSSLCDLEIMLSFSQGFL